VAAVAAALAEAPPAMPLSPSGIFSMIFERAGARGGGSVCPEYAARIHAHIRGE